MALLTAVDPDFNGVVANRVAVSTSDTFANDGTMLLEIVNGGATSINVTVSSPVLCNHGFTHDVTVAVAAGATKIIGPFPTARFNNSNGLVTFACSAQTSVTALVVKTN